MIKFLNVILIELFLKFQNHYKTAATMLFEMQLIKKKRFFISNLLAGLATYSTSLKNRLLNMKSRPLFSILILLFKLKLLFNPK